MTRADGLPALSDFDTDGQRRFQEAQIVVVAAFAIQTPRILLNSAGPNHPRGLANSSGLLGKDLMTHTAANVYGLFHEETENYRGTTGGQLLCQEEYLKDSRRGYVNSAQWLIANALKPNDLLGLANVRTELFGAELERFLKTAAHHLATMTFVGEDLPKPENRLVLTSQKDRFGLPIARLNHSFGPEDISCFEAGIKQGEEVFRAAGSYEVWAGPRVRMHAMGGAIMGREPQNSVTNSYGQTHDIANLFVAGNSLFPTSAAVNPIFTLHAVTLRAAEYVLENWSALT